MMSVKVNSVSKKIVLFVCKPFAQFFAVALFALPVFAQQPNCQINVVTEYLEPYQVKNADGSLGGFATEIVHALFKQANCKANITVMPWARAYEVSQQQPNTLIFSIAHTPKRDQLFSWVGSIFQERLYFWGLKEKFPQPVNNIAQLRPYKVAASRQSNVAQYLADNAFNNIHQLIKEDQNMLMLYRDRVDLIVATELTLKNRAEKLTLAFDRIHKLSEVKALNNDLSIAFNRDSDPELVRHFQSAFEKIQAQGIISELKKKWQIY
jgi:polar amino acid transport system substrate-binding protein